MLYSLRRPSNHGPLNGAVPSFKLSKISPGRRVGRLLCLQWARLSPIAQWSIQLCVISPHFEFSFRCSVCWVFVEQACRLKAWYIIGVKMSCPSNSFRAADQTCHNVVDADDVDGNQFMGVEGRMQGGAHPMQRQTVSESQTRSRTSTAQTLVVLASSKASSMTLVQSLQRASSFVG